MNYRLLIVSICLLFSMITFSQTDSIYFIKKADFSYYKFKKVKYDNSGDIQTEKYITSLQDVTRIKVMGNDSATLFKQGEIPEFTSILNIDHVTKYRYRFSPVLGTLIGIIGGGFLGVGIGYLASGKKDTDEGWWMIGGGFYGTLIGALFGAGITYAINHPTLDLSSVPEKDKMNKLMKFLKDK